MANEKNVQNLGSLRESLTGIETFYVVDYQGLSAGQLTRLRQDIRAKGGQMIVAKNTLINIALQAGGRDLSEALKGPSALVLAQDDPAGVAKTLSDASKANDRGIPTMKGGFVEGRAVDVRVIERLASLGSKQSLQGEFVGVLSAHLSNFVGILEAYQAKLGGGAAEAQA
ncbi:50S ribosomal protein L10 [Deinococcus sp. YIM 134068]|uniref:50S ribosomal protein L10 n=1 Tax=Deinococcus lichenicola TaxID=3118910 RepID=UPI002F924426